MANVIGEDANVPSSETGRKDNNALRLLGVQDELDVALVGTRCLWRRARCKVVVFQPAAVVSAGHRHIVPDATGARRLSVADKHSGGP